MNATRIVFPLVIALALVTVADLEAGIFGRRRERIKAEVSAQLRWEMTRQINAQAAAAKAETTEQIQAEATALKSQVDAALVDMRKAAKSALAAEAEKLQQETAAQLAKLRSEAEAKLAAETEAMKKQIATAVAEIKNEAKTQIAAATEKLSAEVKAETAKVASQVEASLTPKLHEAMLAAIAEQMPKPPTDEQKEEKSETAAVISGEVRTKEEVATDDK
ncbi:hypothetical protein M4951_18040 [Blastopirellula sp. J2-11]|uniref:hypothetical protein n=1 Tax=Blastopirellula sp. J2-11 TaxID=2943192 RepID=UPI0021CAAC22|nr:hypothetical protein [Blastopirellula sp. J2-11]UUO05270.1 hypothetical protein M4951_18040 [Blastopirellula sp. J2-11]